MDRQKHLELMRAFAHVQWGPNPFKKWELEALIKKDAALYGFLGVFL